MPVDKWLLAALREDTATDSPEGTDESAIGTCEEEGIDPNEVEAYMAQNDAMIKAQQQIQEQSDQVRGNITEVSVQI